ncbi:hypothetical protein C3943_22710 [Lysinibacillus sp. B2A1]|nr:hypothetical protein C3943_22710 [Lysinibacillus sp. B2A1]
MSRLGQQEVGHEGVITGRDAFSLRSLICSLQGLICDAESPRSHSVHMRQVKDNQITCLRLVVKKSTTTNMRRNVG